MKHYKYFLDSRTADVKKNGSFKFNLLDSIDHEKSKVMIKLRSMTIPFIYQQINNTNNQIVVNYNFASYNVLLTEGNYTPTQLATEMTFKINAAIGAIIAIQYNSIPNKYVFTNNDPTLSVQLIFNNYENVELYNMVGVDAAGITINPLTTIIGQNQVLLQPVSHYFVKLENYKLKHNYNSRGFGEILEKLEINDVPDGRYSHFYYQDLFEQELITNGYINQLDLSVVDNFNRLIDFDNDKYYILFCVEFKILN